MPDNKIINASSFILIGGFSRRFGSPKWKAELNNIRLIDHMWNMCLDFENRYVIGKEEPEEVSYPFISDALDIQTPLNGIYTALLNSKQEWNFIISCDLPLMNSHVIQLIWEMGDQTADAIIPRVKNYIQSTCAFYHKRALAKIQSIVNQNEFRVNDILDKLNTSYILMDDCEEEFTNMNMVEDYIKIKNRTFNQQS